MILPCKITWKVSLSFMISPRKCQLTTKLHFVEQNYVDLITNITVSTRHIIHPCMLFKLNRPSKLIAGIAIPISIAKFDRQNRYVYKSMGRNIISRKYIFSLKTLLLLLLHFYKMTHFSCFFSSNSFLVVVSSFCTPLLFVVVVVVAVDVVVVTLAVV